jgi:hypothetical protein
MSKNWLEDRAWYRVINLEQGGGDIYASLNGHNFLMQHGETVYLPKAVAEILNNSMVTKYRIEGNMDGGNVRKTYLEPRYMATETVDPNSDGKKSDIIKDIANAKKNKVEKGVE